MAIRVPPKTNGFDHNFFQKITVTWNAFGGSNGNGNSDVFIPFMTQGICLLNEDTTAVVEVSFNGNTVHDELTGGTTSPTRLMMYDNRQADGVWLRLKSGTSAVVSIRAWSVR